MREGGKVRAKMAFTPVFFLLHTSFFDSLFHVGELMAMEQAIYILTFAP